MTLAQTRRRGGVGALAFWTVAVAVGTQLWGDLAAALIIDLALRSLGVFGEFLSDHLCTCAMPRGRAFGGMAHHYV